MLKLLLVEHHADLGLLFIMVTHTFLYYIDDWLIVRTATNLLSSYFCDRCYINC